VISGGRDVDPIAALARRNRQIVRWSGLGALGIIAVALVVLAALLFSGDPAKSPLRKAAAPPPSTAPRLAQLCPPPTEGGTDQYHDVPAPPPGARTVDARSGISYSAQGAPWEPWSEVWTAGALKVSYRVGQHFVTERYVRGEYHASILSGSVPATVNDGLTLDLKCTGQQVEVDVRNSYYPQPNTVEMMRNEQAVLGGRPAWVTKFRLRFTERGLKASDELVGLALIDVGRPQAAVLYISIPGTHRQYDHVVDEVLESVRPA
jgi:hypothetical protein